jgi:hypothetical protein
MIGNRPEPGTKMRLPDGPYGTVTHVEEGIEHGDPVWYVTVIDGWGRSATRWIRRTGR